MKGVVLAGGTGSRLFPLTKVTNKHLLPVGKYPMLFYPIHKLAAAGIRDIMIVTGTEHMGSIVGVLGSGHDLGLDFTFRVQDRAGGIAEALGLARDFVGDDTCAVILGDNIFEADISGDVEEFSAKGAGARILLREVSDPGRFGVAEVKDGKIVAIEEKPQEPKSNLVVTGIYLYDSRVFDIIAGLRPSGRGELEISDTNNRYIEQGEMAFGILEGWWTDAGTFDSLAHANELAADVSLGTFESADTHSAG